MPPVRIYRIIAQSINRVEGMSIIASGDTFEGERGFVVNLGVSESQRLATGDDPAQRHTLEKCAVRCEVTRQLMDADVPRTYRLHW